MRGTVQVWGWMSIPTSVKFSNLPSNTSKYHILGNKPTFSVRFALPNNAKHVHVYDLEIKCYQLSVALR